MDPFRIESFSGAVRGVESRLLPKEYAVESNNGKFLDGSLSSWRSPIEIATPTKASVGTVQTIYRLTISGTDYWLNWLTDVDVVRDPTIGSTWLHWTGDNEPRTATQSQATAGPDYPSAFYVFGVWQPSAAPTVTPTGGVGSASDRAYLYTHVTVDGFEGAPSPASAVTTGKVDDTWAIGGLTEPANSGTISNAVHSTGVITVTVNTTYGLRAGEQITIAAVVGMTDLNGTFNIAEVTNSTTLKINLTTAQTYISGGTWDREADHNIDRVRIYRTKDGLSTTEYYFVAEQASNLTSYNDTIADADLGSIIETETWLMPPVTLKGLREGPNETLIAFDGNTLYYSVPGAAYAWPTETQYSVPDQIVAVEVYDSTVFILTDKSIWLAVGSTPENVTIDPSNINWPCLSKRSVVRETDGIFFASSESVCLVGPNATGKITDQTLLKRQWETTYFPDTIVGGFYHDLYFGFYTDSSQFVRGFFVQRGNPLTHVTDIDYPVTAVYMEGKKERELYFVSDGKVRQWDSAIGSRLTFDWLSKVLISRKPINPQTMRVFADYDALSDNESTAEQQAQVDIDQAFNDSIFVGTDPIEGEINGVVVHKQEVNGSLLRYVGESFSTRFLTVTLIADGKDKKTKNLTSNRPFKLPHGYTASEFQIRFGGNIGVFRIEIAGSAQGLNLV